MIARGNEPAPQHSVHEAQAGKQTRFTLQPFPSKAFRAYNHIEGKFHPTRHNFNPSCAFPRVSLPNTTQYIKTI